MTRHVREINDLRAFDRATAHPHATLHGTVVEALDLTDRTRTLATVDVAGAVFLGCTFDDDTASALRAAGALLFPNIPQVPFDPYQPTLYTADDLYDAPDYAHAYDARVYAWTRRADARRALVSSLATALHDHSIEVALDDELARVPFDHVVGIMGGHGLLRTDPGYAEAAALARALTREGRIVLTGGGPGAMEAANLGAYLAPASDDALPEALDLLAAAPSFRPSIDAWARQALLVRERFPNGGHSLGIPTWFYGHEPPNPFPTRIAKFFANPIREATLLARCGGGIVYLPGAAGTVQEIFADACENYYADPALVAPMVLVGRGWTDELPAWQLLRALGAGTPMGERLFLVDTAMEAVTALGCSPETRLASA